MTGSAPSDRFEELLAHGEWVRRVARALVHDEDGAADLEQEVWLRAADAPAVRSPRAWLGTVLRNTALNMKLAERRRKARDTSVPSPRALPSPDEMVERAEVVERVARAVRTLDEPYRTAVFLRYFEDRSPPEIAAQLDVPLETVRTRLRRALVLLRERLDEDHGRSRSAWAGVLLAWERPGHAPVAVGTAASAVVGGAAVAAVKNALIAAAVLVLVVGGVALLRPSGSDDAARTPITATSVAAPHAAPRSTDHRAAAQPTAGESTGDDGDLPPPIDLDKCDRDLDLHGVVVRKDGTPVAGAHVTALARPWRRTSFLNMDGYHQSVARLATRTARDGTFVLRLERGEQSWLRVSAPALSTVELPARQAGERVRVVLADGVRLKIVATVAGGAPAVGATFRVRPSRAAESESAQECTTDSAGVAVVDSLPAGADVVTELQSGGFAGNGSAKCRLPDSGEQVLPIELTGGRTIRGRATDAATGAEIAGARVGMNWTLDRPVTTTDDGTYELTGWTGNGVHDICAVSEGYARASEKIGARETVHFALHRGFAATGRVVGPDGVVVADAQIGAIASVITAGEQRTSFGHTATDAKGRFRITGLACDMPHFLIVTAARHARYRAPMASGAAGAEVELGDVAMATPRAIEGRVVDTEGGPVVGATVSIEGPFAPDESRFTNEFYGLTEDRSTDDLGRFRFPDLAPGRYAVVVRRTGEPENAAEVVVPKDRDVLDVAFTRPSTRSVVVHVRDQAGRPLAGAIVTAGGRTEGRTTDAAGDVTFSLETSTVDVRAFPPDIANRRFLSMSPVPVPRGAAEATIVLHEGVALRGRVLDPDGKALAQAMVAFVRPGEPPMSMSTNADGVFEIVLPAGTVVTVEFACSVARQEAPYAGRVEGVVPGKDEVVLRLERLAADRVLRVRVTSPDGDPVPGAKVSVHTVGSAAFPRLLTADDRGVVEVAALPARPVTISAGPGAMPGGGAWFTPRPLEVVPDGTEVVFAMRRALPIRGRLIGADGKPARGSVSAWCSKNYYVGAGADAEGAFTLPLPADERGPWRLVAYFAAPGDRVDTVEVNDVASGAVDVRIAQPPK